MKSREEELLARIDEQGKRVNAQITEFRYDALQNAYVDVLTGFFYKDPKSVNALIPIEYWPMKIAKDAKTGEAKEILIKPANYLANVGNGLLVETSTWWPGMPRIIEGWLAVEGAMIKDDRRVMFNAYRPPDPVDLPQFAKALKGEKLAQAKLEIAKKLDADAATWTNHIKALWPDPKEHEYFFDYCAHMIQRPEEKCNSIIALSGKQGIGKDISLIPVKAAVGQWNVCDISPDEFASPYNPWVQCVMLIINEMRPTKEDFHASSIYEKLKRISVTPPDTISVSDKYMRMRYIVNVLRIFVTTNDMTAMYINPDDRRFAIFHSTKDKDWQPASYFTDLVNWLTREDGNIAVARWLAARDITKFEPKRKPDETAGWKAIVSGWSAPNDAVAASLEALHDPEVFFSNELYTNAFDNKEEITSLLRHPRKVTHRMQQSGYFVIPLNPPMTFKGESKTLKFKYAFAKYALMHEPEKYNALLQERGRMLADGIAILNQNAIPSAPTPAAKGGF